MAYQAFKQFIIGRPLPTERLAGEKLPKRYALPIFSSDALSSTAYATEEILIVLALAGVGALYLSVPIAIAITVLLAIVVFSYRQLILAYPSGGGAYVVSKENLGETPSLIAGASLLVDYSLTVAVSISAGVAAITSAFPLLLPYTEDLALLALVIMVISNLRGTREAGRIFAVPTYAFILGLGTTIIYGFFLYVTGHKFIITPNPTHTIEPIALFLILRAFASGCTALTGVEAISNAVQSFRHPEAQNARITLVLMGLILGSLFLGTTELARILQVTPSPVETVVSQITREVFGGKHFFYYFVQITTTLILILAANTSFAGFPNLVSVMANDGYMPRQLRHRGFKLAYSNGIVLLAIFAGILILAFRANTNSLIPLYAVGVFTGFTLSQSGMVKHWYDLRKHVGPGWWHRAIINGIGGVTTLVVTLVLAITKFINGAWIVLIIIPVLVWIFRKIHKHYSSIAVQLSVEQLKSIPAIKHNIVVLVSTIHVGTAIAARYAQSLNPTVIRAIHVNIDDLETERVRTQWEQLNFGISLEIIDSPYRDVIGPIIGRLRQIEREMTDDIMSVIIPEFVVSHWWEYFLHNQTALVLRGLLFFWPNAVVISIPQHLQ